MVLTSDHGEMFERGISGHGSRVLYQPVVRIPLMIFEPGQQMGADIYEYTSAVDVLPTLAHLTGQETPVGRKESFCRHTQLPSEPKCLCGTGH